MFGYLIVYILAKHQDMWRSSAVTDAVSSLWIGLDYCRGRMRATWVWVHHKHGDMRVQPKHLLGVCCPVCACVYPCVGEEFLSGAATALWPGTRLSQERAWWKAMRNGPSSLLEALGWCHLLLSCFHLAVVNSWEAQVNGRKLQKVRPSRTMEGDCTWERAEGAGWGAGR